MLPVADTWPPNSLAKFQDWQIGILRISATIFGTMVISIITTTWNLRAHTHMNKHAQRVPGFNWYSEFTCDIWEALATLRSFSLVGSLVKLRPVLYHKASVNFPDTCWKQSRQLSIVRDQRLCLLILLHWQIILCFQKILRTFALVDIMVGSEFRKDSDKWNYKNP